MCYERERAGRIIKKEEVLGHIRKPAHIFNKAFAGVVGVSIRGSFLALVVF